ncbi:MAG: tetratricopeptide repeat protein [Chloroflexota bacterium]|nr:tetratricopeptide repeat protein [Chloroflexota bacterium]
MRRDRFPRTRRIPWELLMIMGGLLAASIAWMSLDITPVTWRRWLGLISCGGLLMCLVGVGLALYHRRRTMRGLGYGISPTHRLGAVIALLLIAFGISFWPLPFLHPWIHTALAILCGLGAVALGLGLVESTSLDFRRARQAYERGEDESALALLGALEEEDPAFCPTYHLRAVIHRQGGHYEKAAETCRRLIDLCPDLYYGHAELGMTLLKKREAGQAIAPLKRALEIAPNLPQAQFVLGVAQAQGGKPEEAIDALSRALRMGLHNKVHQLLARYYLYQSLLGAGYEERAQRERRRLHRQRRTLRRWLDGEDEQEHPLPPHQVRMVQKDLKELLDLD